MSERMKKYLELGVVYVLLLLIVAFSNTMVSLWKSIPTKMMMTLLIPTMMTLIPIVIYKVRNRKVSELGFKKVALMKQVLIGVCIFAITITVAVVLPLVLGFNKSDVLSFKPSSIGILIFYLIYRLIFIGFSEEIIFRGYYYNEISHITNAPIKAIIFSSLLFGVVHYPNGFNLVQVVVVSIIGMFYGLARYKIKNCTLLSLGLGHGLHDATITLLSFLLLN